MGGKQGLGPQPLFVGAVLQHRPGDGHAVVGGGAPADLVQDEQVERMLKDALFVPNDTYMDGGADRLSIITGPNMAGKSTYMRSFSRPSRAATMSAPWSMTSRRWSTSSS